MAPRVAPRLSEGALIIKGRLKSPPSQRSPQSCPECGDMVCPMGSEMYIKCTSFVI